MIIQNLDIDTFYLNCEYIWKYIIWIKYKGMQNFLRTRE